MFIFNYLILSFLFLKILLQLLKKIPTMGGARQQGLGDEGAPSEVDATEPTGSTREGDRAKTKDMSPIPMGEGTEPAGAGNTLMTTLNNDDFVCYRETFLYQEVVDQETAPHGKEGNHRSQPSTCG